MDIKTPLVIEGPFLDEPSINPEPVVNPYVEELKSIILNKKFLELTNQVRGFPHAIRAKRRARNYRSRASRRINRFLAKGKHL